MVTIIALLITAAILGAASRFRLPGFSKTRDLGWMSKQWLAEYRAANGL
jgi:hypothetical protein